MNHHETSHYQNDKSKHFEAQMKRVYQKFTESPQTMLQVAIATNVMRSNITWYFRIWRKHDKIILVKKGLCPITGFMAGFYTTVDNVNI